MGSRPLLGRVPALSVAWASPRMLSGQLGLSFSIKQTCSRIVTKRNLIYDKVICLSVFEES